MSLGQQVKQFNDTYKQDQSNLVAALPDPQGLMAWVSIVGEEFNELQEAFEKGDTVEYYDACLDVIYAMAQQMELYGFPVDLGLREVHRSNMSKLDEEGKPIIREDGKVLKGKGFSEPDLKAILDNQKEEVTSNG